MTHKSGNITPNEIKTDSYHWQLHGETQAQFKAIHESQQRIDKYFTENGIATQVAVNKQKIGWLSKFVWGLFLTFMTTGFGVAAAYAFRKIWP